jgi:hypothetical protein
MTIQPNGGLRRLVVDVALRPWSRSTLGSRKGAYVDDFWARPACSRLSRDEHAARSPVPEFFANHCWCSA